MSIKAFAIYIIQCIHNSIDLQLNCRSGGAEGSSVRLASGRLGVRITDATELSRKNS